MTKVATAFIAIVSLIVGLAIGIWGDTVDGKNQTILFFLIYFAFWTVKVFLDDLSHFSSNSSDPNKLASGFGFSLIMWILYLITFAISSKFYKISLLLFLVSFIISTVWIGYNYIGVTDEDPKVNRRHKHWLYINNIHIVGLVAAITFAEKPSFQIAIFLALTVIVLFDMIYYGTIRRLVD